ncbi:MAG: LON peptidase substrate-binding domain-containing protein [Gammaproteobacteria bacterium]
MEIAEVPLFPLKTVLFPGGPLPLRVFEPRYLDMISHCLRHEHGFGVVLIRQGQEVGPAEIHDVGTMAEIVDWYQGSDGLLGVTAQGRGRFHVASVRVQANGLQVGQIEPIRPEPSQPLPDVFAPMARVLSEIIDDLGSHYQDLDKHYNDASWVGYRFAEILPVPATQRQAYLEMNDPVQRLEMLRPFLKFSKGEN